MSFLFSVLAHTKSIYKISPIFIQRIFKGHISENREAVYESVPSDNIIAFFREPDHIIDNLYLGSSYHASQWEWLETNKITHIVNVALEVPDFFSEDLIYIPCQSIKDNGVDTFQSELDTIIDTLYKNKNNKNESVLVHCLVGRSRSATIILAYLIKYHQMSPLEALEFVKQKRNVINPSKKLMDYLTSWSKKD